MWGKWAFQGLGHFYNVCNNGQLFDMPIWKYEDIFWDLVVKLVYNTQILSQKEHDTHDGHGRHNNANTLVCKSVYTDVVAAV
jgi:hypothetical protein